MVRILNVLVPASGSVMAKQNLLAPVTVPGSQRCFCSSEPWRETTMAPSPGLTTRSTMGTPARASVSSTRASSWMPSPAPP